MKLDRVTFESELSFRTSRSSGPGGQAVNKTETKVEALFHIEKSNLLNDDQKQKLRVKLANRINSEDQLAVSASDSRGQLANKESAIVRMIELIEDALKPLKPRKKSKPSKSAIRKRLEAKTKRAEVKKKRGWRLDE